MSDKTIMHLARILQEWDMKPWPNDHTGHSYEDVARDALARLGLSTPPPPSLHREPIEADLLDRAELAWQRFFYPANDCFTGDPGDKLPSVDLEVADCLRLLLAAVGRHVVTPEGDVSASSIPANNGPIEADREAAGNAWVATWGKSHIEDRVMAIFNGQADDSPLVQAFMRHRLAFSTLPAAASVEAGERAQIVAPKWLHAEDCEAMQRPRADCTCVPTLAAKGKDQTDG